MMSSPETVLMVKTGTVRSTARPWVAVAGLPALGRKYAVVYRHMPASECHWRKWFGNLFRSLQIPLWLCGQWNQQLWRLVDRYKLGCRCERKQRQPAGSRLYKNIHRCQPRERLAWGMFDRNNGCGRPAFAQRGNTHKAIKTEITGNSSFLNFENSFRFTNS